MDTTVLFGEIYNFYYNYTYLVACFIAGILWLIIYLARKDLRKEILFTSLIFSTFGLTEVFFKEYWSPKSYLGLIERFGVGIEDILYCFFLGGVAAAVWEFIFRKKEYILRHKIRNHHVLATSSVTATTVTLAELYLPNYTIFTFCIIVTIITFVGVLIWRRDLFMYVLESGVVFTFIYVVAAMILFLPVNYFERFYNFQYLTGIHILYIPIEEYLMGFCFGVLGAFMYKYLRDIKLIKNSKY